MIKTKVVVSDFCYHGGFYTLLHGKSNKTKQKSPTHSFGQDSKQFILNRWGHCYKNYRVYTHARFLILRMSKLCQIFNADGFKHDLYREGHFVAKRKIQQSQVSRGFFFLYPCNRSNKGEGLWVDMAVAPYPSVAETTW